MRSHEGSRATDDPLDARLISSQLTTRSLGRAIIHAPSTGSTNEDAKALVRRYLEQSEGEAERDPEGTLVISDRQTAGKGRLGRRWTSAAGGIFMTVVLRPRVSPDKMPLISIVAGYSVAAAVRSVTGICALVKWPNDVLVGGKKVCGILSEMCGQEGPGMYVVCGIGINANQAAEDFPTEIRDTATSLRAAAGAPVDRNRVVAAVLNLLESGIYELERSGGLGTLKDDLARVTAYVGERVTLRNRAEDDGISISGMFRGIDENGRALVEVPGEGVVPFSAGDLSLRPS